MHSALTSRQTAPLAARRHVQMDVVAQTMEDLRVQLQRCPGAARVVGGAATLMVTEMLSPVVMHTTTAATDPFTRTEMTNISFTRQQIRNGF